MANTVRFITPEMVDRIKVEMRKGKSLLRVAFDFGVPYHTLYRLVRRLEKKGAPMPPRRRLSGGVPKMAEAYLKAKAAP